MPTLFECDFVFEDCHQYFPDASIFSLYRHTTFDVDHIGAVRETETAGIADFSQSLVERLVGHFQINALFQQFLGRNVAGEQANAGTAESNSVK